MSIISIFNLFLYQPSFNLLILLYIYIPGHDLGVAVIVLTILVRLLFYPLSVKSIKTQEAMNKIQPRLKEVKEKFKNDVQKQSAEMMALYKKHNISPWSNFLLMLIQIPVIIALFQVFSRGFGPEILQPNLYSFIAMPDLSSPTLFGILNLTQSNMVVAVLAGVTQFFQTKMITPSPKKDKGGSKKATGAGMQKSMLYLFPLFTIYILSRLNSAVGLYWLTSNLFALVQQYYLLKRKHD